MYITGAETLILFVCLLRGVLCPDWSTTMPLRVEGLRGSCVVIPCSFTLSSEYESFLTASCKGIWRKGWRELHVFDSSLTGTGRNLIPGNLTGNLEHKDCTTILNDSIYLNNYFYFRLECNSPLKANFQESVTIEMKEDPSKPTLTPPAVEVMEGTPVSLICSAAAPCPTRPPTLTWSPTLTGSMQGFPESQTQVLSSVLNFTVSHVHHGETITCTALYKRKPGMSEKSARNSLTLTVFYSPKNTSVSVSPSPSVEQDSKVTLSCSSAANPNIRRYHWYRVIGEQATQIAAKRVTAVQVPADYSYFYCEAINDHGTQNSSVIRLNGMYPPTNISVSVNPSGPVLEGNSVKLTCTSFANPAVENYTWFRVEGTEGVLVGSGESLTIGGKASDSGEYYCEALHALGIEKATVVQLDIQYPPRNTTVSVNPSDSVTEGSSVTLACSSDANPGVINFTWYRVEGREKDIVGSEEDLNILNVTRLPNEQYYCKASNVHGLQDSEAIGVNVTFSSEILNTSHCIRIAATSQIRCFCDSLGNPKPTLVWRLAGETFNHSSNTVIKEEPMGTAGLRSSLTIRQSQEEEIPALVCLSTNSEGSDSFSFNLTSLETYEGFHPLSLFIGAGVGAGVMMLLCIPLLLFCKHRRAGQSTVRGQIETAELIVTDRPLSQEEDIHYANIAMLKEALGAEGTEEGDKEDADIHYANLNFSKLQADLGAEEIRGVSQMTEYTMIRLHSTGSTAEEAGEGKVNAGLGNGYDNANHGAKAVEGTLTQPKSVVDQVSGLKEQQVFSSCAPTAQSSSKASLGQHEQCDPVKSAVEVTLLPGPKSGSVVEEEATYGNVCHILVISEANGGPPGSDQENSKDTVSGC